MTLGLDIAVLVAALAAGTMVLAVRKAKMSAIIIKTMRPPGPGPRRAS